MLVRKFSFWLPLLSLILCISDRLGSELANLLLAGANPLFHALIFSDTFSSWMIDVHNAKWQTNSALIALAFPAYLLHFAICLTAGVLLDLLIHMIRKQRGQKNGHV